MCWWWLIAADVVAAGDDTTAWVVAVALATPPDNTTGVAIPAVARTNAKMAHSRYNLFALPVKRNSVQQPSDDQDF